jgi:hypothetical protein
MRDNVRKFLINHKYILDKPLKEITKEDIKQIYLDANNEEPFDADSFCVGELTQILLKKLDPLDYLTTIPDSYLAGTDITEFIVPDHITHIGAGAFYECKELLKVIIPKSVSEINMYAFAECEKLRVLRINNRYPTISETAFQGTKHIAKIYYEGKEDDWDLIWPHSPISVYVECTDRVLGPYV